MDHQLMTAGRLELKTCLATGGAPKTMSDADDDAEEAADGGLDDGLDEELGDDVLPLGAEGPADADLAGAFGDGGEHDVHDADAADEQRDARR